MAQQKKNLCVLVSLSWRYFSKKRTWSVIFIAIELKDESTFYMDCAACGGVLFWSKIRCILRISVRTRRSQKVLRCFRINWRVSGLSELSLFSRDTGPISLTQPVNSLLQSLIQGYLLLHWARPLQGRHQNKHVLICLLCLPDLSTELKGTFA